MRVTPERRSIQSSYSNDCGRVCRVSSLSEETANRENSKSAWLWLVGWPIIANQSHAGLLFSLLAVSSREDTLPTPPQSICVRGQDALPL